jgi:putative heme iron utilization protein
VNRPSEHGGGEAAPPIAGDPSSFPSDAELARTLVATGRRAALCTLTEAGYPYGSAVSYAADNTGAPIVLISEMAEHTVNARRDPRASVLVTAEARGDTDPLSTARLTLVGLLEVLDDPGARRDTYLAAHPYAAYYADFTDFAFWRLAVETCRFVGGFGHMSWVDAAGYAGAGPDPIASGAAGIVEHMNDDHRDANLLYVQRLAGLPTATDASMVGLDRYGVTLRADTPEGPRMARVPFAAPIASVDDARPAVIALLENARSRS